MASETGTLELSGDVVVSTILDRPPDAGALLVLAHGAGAGMRHPFMERLTAALAARRVAVFRYQFPYLEAGKRRVDPAPVLEQTVRAAVAAAREVAPDLPLFAGGKSLGGRMSSRAAASPPGLEVRGLVCFGFPLHPPRRPATERAVHLAAVPVPMLFLQGTRDDLADLALIGGVTATLPLATLHVVAAADHGFDVLKRCGRTAEEVLAELADTAAGWISERAR
jgi:predicted alpha/beta-hydrolase family hydrolase